LASRLPRRILIKRRTPLTVHAGREVPTLTRQPILQVPLLLHRAPVGVAVTLAPAAHSDARNGVVIGLEHLRVVEHLVAERVQAIQRDADVGGGHPLVQLRAALEVVRARPVLERAEDDGGARHRRDVTELVRAAGDRLIVGKRNFCINSTD